MRMRMREKKGKRIIFFFFTYPTPARFTFICWLTLAHQKSYPPITLTNILFLMYSNLYRDVISFISL